VESGDVILTHCNSAAALSILVESARSGKDITVYATETRPRFQGRITAKVLDKHGIRTFLIVDSAVRYYMNKISKVFVGADAILIDGTLINKIGTSVIAVIAEEFNVPFYVAAETYKFDPTSIFGYRVKIEERSETEVVPPQFLRKLKHVKVLNPAFDITPPKYITAIISEVGICSPTQFPLVAKETLQLSYSELTPWE